MSDPYYTFYPGDYQRDTQDLSLMEHGAYRLLLDYYYIERKLPNNKERLYRICKANTQTEQNAVDYIAGKFFHKINGLILKNKRADKEIEKRDRFLSEQKRKSALGVQARKQQPTGEPTGKPEEQPYPSPSPSPIPKPKKKKEYVEQARRIFDYWKEKTGKARALYSEERKKKIMARLKEGYSEQEAQKAIDNCLKSDYHIQGGYIDITLIFRNVEKFERFRDGIKGKRPYGAPDDWRPEEDK